MEKHYRLSIGSYMKDTMAEKFGDGKFKLLRIDFSIRVVRFINIRDVIQLNGDEDIKAKEYETLSFSDIHIYFRRLHKKTR